MTDPSFCVSGVSSLAEVSVGEVFLPHPVKGAQAMAVQSSRVKNFFFIKSDVPFWF